MNAKILGLAKKFTAGILTAGMVAACVAAVPNKAEAAVVADEVIYEERTDFKDYYKDKKAPVKEGYVFGGWCSAANDNSHLTEATAATAESAYAKFVPANVLSIKAQNAANTTADSESTTVRVITSLDSMKYQKVGFDIWYRNTIDLKGTSVLETTKAYAGLTVGSDTYTANQIFGGVSNYLSVWYLTNAAQKDFGSIIYVRPYWITLDGTKVEGLAKYVHIEDSYKGYISVPVNLLTGEEIAAGTVQMTYTTSTALEFVGFEAGRLLPEMECNSATAGTIKMVGNAENVSDVVKADGLYANIRFKKTDTTLRDFTMTVQQFCNWNEELVNTVKAWDIKY